MHEEPITMVTFAIQTFIMPQIEQNMYLNALNQAKLDIVHWINMPAMYPLPDASIASICLFTGVSWKRKNMLTDKI